MMRLLSSHYQHHFDKVSFRICDQYGIVTVGNARYVALLGKENASMVIERSGNFLATVIAARRGLRITKKWLQDILDSYATSDDVFRWEFVGGLIFIGASRSEVEITDGARDFLATLGNEWIELLDSSSQDVSIGPCAFVDGRFASILRLFDDTSKAFVVSLKPPVQGLFADLGVTGCEYQTLSVALPSRLSFSKHPTRALNGWRIAVKDNFLLKGLRTSLCNKAYYELYPPADKTAACIEHLIEAGAVIVGKTKLSSMVSTEEPTQGIDFQTAWNPRADGYQSPAGSSSGSGAAIASYEWLDIAIGSDTSGSGRRPAHWNGCFGLRPTHGLLPNEGFIRSFNLFDTPTFFGRDLAKCRKFVEVWYGDKILNSKPKFPTSIIYPSDYLPTNNLVQQEIIDQFIRELEASLGLKHTKLSFQKLWDERPPEAARGQGLENFMENVPRDAYWYDDFLATASFRDDYREKYHKEAYVSPAVRYQWNNARHISRSVRDEAMRRIGHYKKWFLTEVMQDGLANTLIILPIEDLSPRYRDEPPLGKDPLVPPTPTTGTGVLFESPATGSPELVIPVGEVPFESKITGNTEYLPMGISLMALPGSDLMLMDIAQKCLELAGRPTTVFAGRSMFHSKPLESAS